MTFAEIFSYRLFLSSSSARFDNQPALTHLHQKHFIIEKRETLIIMGLGFRHLTGGPN